MNSVNITGRITKDIEAKKTNSGKSVCSFSVAVQRDKDNADFIPCTAWNATAENLAKYFHKGDRIGITGVLSTRTFESNGDKRFIMEVLVREFDFLNSKRSDLSESKPAPIEEPNQMKSPDAESEISGVFPFEI